MKKNLLAFILIALGLTTSIPTVTVAPRNYTINEIKEKTIVWMVGVLFKLPIYKIRYMKENFLESVICRAKVSSLKPNTDKVTSSVSKDTTSVFMSTKALQKALNANTYKIFMWASRVK